MSIIAWTKYNGIDVAIDDHGEFCAEVNGVFLRDPRWEGLRQRIEQESKSDAKSMKVELDCIVLVGDADDGDYSVLQLTLVGLNRKDSTFKWAQKSDSKKIVYVLPYSRKNYTLLEQLALAKSTVRDIEQAIDDRVIRESKWGGRIEPTKYNNELVNLKARYEKAWASGGV